MQFFFCSQALLFLKRESAQKVLTEFQKRPEAWTKVDAILQKSQFSNTKFFALGILEELIKFKWKILPENQRDGIKNFVVTLIIQIASDPNRLKAEKLFINKLNLTLVQVTYSPKKSLSTSLSSSNALSPFFHNISPLTVHFLCQKIIKQQWPRGWNTFIPEIVGASKTNESLCENNMNILKLMRFFCFFSIPFSTNSFLSSSHPILLFLSFVHFPTKTIFNLLNSLF